MTDPEILDAELLRRFPLPHHPDDGDKEDRGRLLVVAGSRELPGAALLAGIAALRAGAGKLQIATAASIAVQIGVAAPEARVIGLEETEAGCIAESEIDRLLEWAGAAQAVLLGCGLQHGGPLETLLDRLFEARLDVPLVLDAAVLGSLAERADALKAWPGGSILLPHAGEMARLLDYEREEVSADPLAAARRAAETFGAVTLIKGEYSHVVSPDGQAFRFKGGGVGLATSGSGDTLAGIVGGLAARGADPLTAVMWGVYLHGEAGRRLATKHGRVGFLARELLDYVPALMEGR
ncbi:MAG: ADP-dependent (S)-NAD(P)H-hydrate dehydratase [uncultured Sphingosinicella sp.]|uniref:ADP-dependent (S)-NAD(P)H-hydrate dehydratase n=1 Tax=uncultured Sphingosinicella sp. TaxID=478748 RepID=A0A6J4U7U4_9SPHN|nr:NAD(P)H-hydrate dehydratase [uncultured Sphingosinicella sp.]CAA9540518.1 MAG: ADP-dependent (S)-NAD(P)H-hydrate dehydratase [uncultured Sphingosinicella sp.]